MAQPFLKYFTSYKQDAATLGGKGTYGIPVFGNFSGHADGGKGTYGIPGPGWVTYYL